MHITQSIPEVLEEEQLTPTIFRSKVQWKTMTNRVKKLLRKLIFTF